MSISITPLNDVIHYKDKHTIVKGIIYLRLLEKNVLIPNNMLNVLALFAMYSDKQKVIEEALSHKFYKSSQTVDNVISSLVTDYKFLDKNGDKIRNISNNIFPHTTSSDFIAATLKVHNIQSN